MKYRELTKYRYQVIVDEAFKTSVKPPKKLVTKYILLDTDGTLIAREGYAWNGASKPAINTKTNRRASCAHDAFYQVMNLGLLDLSFRLLCDEEYYKICLADGMWKVRADLEKWVLNNFAEFAAKPDGKREVVILECP
mgnify:CR=1 FL=1